MDPFYKEKLTRRERKEGTGRNGEKRERGKERDRARKIILNS